MVTIAYIEDDPLSRQVLTLLLTRKMGYADVTVLEDSTDFLAKLQALPKLPDVVFVDIHMRPHDGFHVLATLRALESFQTTKIVAVTASVMNEEVDLLRKAGFDGVIGKPINSATFPDLFQRILQGEKIWRPT